MGEEVLSRLGQHCPDSVENAGKERAKMLGEQLSSYGVDVSLLEYSGRCGLSLLDWELNIHKSMTLEPAPDGGIQRVVNLVRFWIVAEVGDQSLVLMERKEQKNGSKYYPGHVQCSGASL